MRPRLTARLTGAAYLVLVVLGLVGFLLIRPALRVTGDPAATLDNLVQQPTLAAAGVVIEAIVVITQAAAALGFYALLRRDHPTAAFGVAGFGLANAIIILTSAGVLATATAVAHDASLAPAGDAAATVGLLYALSDAAWTVGAVFFGLWLIPMGAFALATRRMPLVLGWILVVGGVGYVLSALLGAVAPGPLADALTYPATIGELWMVGYLLIVGIRPAAQASTSGAGAGSTPGRSITNAEDAEPASTR